VVEGEFERRLPMVLPGPSTTATSSGGNTFSRRSARKAAVCGVLFEGFAMTQLPAAIASTSGAMRELERVIPMGQ
jgi:hypothetical protein